MSETNFSLDRTQFKMHTFQEADNNYEYWSSKSHEERLEAAYYLISIAYGFDVENPPKMNKEIFSMRKCEL